MKRKGQMGKSYVIHRKIIALALNRNVMKKSITDRKKAAYKKPPFLRIVK